MKPCEGGSCGPLVDASEEPDAPIFVGLPVIPDREHQFMYCPRCFTTWRWDVYLQRHIPWPVPRGWVWEYIRPGHQEPGYLRVPGQYSVTSQSDG